MTDTLIYGDDQLTFSGVEPGDRAIGIANSPGLCAGAHAIRRDPRVLDVRVFKSRLRLKTHDQPDVWQNYPLPAVLKRTVEANDNGTSLNEVEPIEVRPFPLSARNGHQPLSGRSTHRPAPGGRARRAPELRRWSNFRQEGR